MIVFGLLALKFVLRFISLTIGLICTESYSTSLRAMGIGIGGAISTIMAATAPIFLYNLFLVD